MMAPLNKPVGKHLNGQPVRQLWVKKVKAGHQSSEQKDFSYSCCSLAQ
jgi:hypothetical protein